MENSNFSERLKDIFTRNPINFSNLGPKIIVSKELEEVIKKYIPKKSQWYNIHKRTTNGRIDQPVIWRVNEKDANLLINKFLKASEKVNQITGQTECMFYEKVSQDGHRSDMYENNCKITKGEIKWTPKN